jgi:arylsulfatase A-like enzyme
VADYCGIARPDSIEGHSLRPIIENPDARSPHESFVWQTTFNDQWAVRKGDWKLIVNPYLAKNGERFPMQDAFLYNLSVDPGEKEDKITEEPEIERELKEIYEKWKAGNMN